VDAGYLLDWVNLLLRWAHVITAIAWIGSSFYFVFLDSSLTPPNDPDLQAKGVNGELWAVHGGGFYHPQKYLVAPRQLPDKLHWFFWESYSTWLTGFALFTVLYLVNAGSFLVDARVFAWGSNGAAVAAALGFLFGFWFVYDAIGRLAGVTRDRMVGSLVALVVVAMSWAACQLFAGRAAFLIVGAALATAMSANVLVWIIPGQRKVIAQMRAGQAVDPIHGQRGKQRSVHNTYFTLPVLIAMLSNHYGWLTGASGNWLALVALMLAGALIRHSFVARHKALVQGQRVPWEWAGGGVLLLLALVAALAPAPRSAAVALPAPTTAQVQAVVQQRCVLCHGAESPQKGVALHSAALLEQHAAAVYQQVVVEKRMPLNNATGLTEEERLVVGRWFEGRRSEAACLLSARSSLGVFNPCTPTPFSLRRQRKGGKRKAGLLRSPLPAKSGQGFPALLDKGPTRRTRCARFAPSAQTSCASQKGCVPAARGPLVCAARRRRRRATANSQQPDLGSLTQQAGALTTADNELIAGCSVFGCPTPSAPPSSTEDRPACRRHATLLTRPACLSGGSRRRAQRVLAGAGLASSAGNPLRRRRGASAVRGRRSIPPFLWRSKEKGVGVQGRSALGRGLGVADPHGLHRMKTRPIKFWHQGALRELADPPSTRTVLDWLREDQHLTGSKEGCAEGDCGACTVVIGELDEQQELQLKPANACIQFLPSLDGKALFTIEDLGGQHPVQQALVDCHASQCGFCTPGFAMSLWQLWEELKAPPSPQQIRDGLSGNLCRCTGYRPIVEAGLQACARPAPKLDRAPIEAALRSLLAAPALHTAQGFHAPRSLAELAALREAKPEARLLAGSTDVGLWVTKHSARWAKSSTSAAWQSWRASSRTTPACTSVPAHRWRPPGRRSPRTGPHCARSGCASPRRRCVRLARWAATSPTARRSATRHRC
jgi:uncharacterized membrane protein/aerobic-type carbon monoxide dehydrogenase small subunit (CoxS/CutS family)